jgi:hypothetical protein
MKCGNEPFLESRRHGVWVPAFAGTTRDGYPLAAPALANRLRMRMSRVSQTSR